MPKLAKVPATLVSNPPRPGRVLRLADYKSQETIRVLRAALARAERGDLVAVALGFRSRSGRDDVAFTGTYRARPSAAVAVAARMTHLAQLQDLQEIQA